MGPYKIAKQVNVRDTMAKHHHRVLCQLNAEERHAFDGCYIDNYATTFGYTYKRDIGLVVITPRRRIYFLEGAAEKTKSLSIIRYVDDADRLSILYGLYERGKIDFMTYATARNFIDGTNLLC